MRPFGSPDCFVDAGERFGEASRAFKTFEFCPSHLSKGCIPIYPSRADIALSPILSALEIEGGMARCDFEIIDNDGHKPWANHLYLLEAVEGPMLKRLAVGSTPDEATSVLLAESARMRQTCEEVSGLQTRCFKVWLHGAYLKDGLEAALDAMLVPSVLVAPTPATCGQPTR